MLHAAKRGSGCQGGRARELDREKEGDREDEKVR